MSFDDQSDFNGFDLRYRATPSQHREIELRLQTSPEYQEWAVLQAAIRNGRGYAKDEDYLALCRQLVHLQVACTRSAYKIINEVLS